MSLPLLVDPPESPGAAPVFAAASFAGGSSSLASPTAAAGTHVVRRVSDPAELNEFYYLRYRAYVEGMWRAAHGDGPGCASIVDALDDGCAIHLGAFGGSELHAVLRLNLGSRSDLGEYVRLFDVAGPAWGVSIPQGRTAIGSRFAWRPGHASPALAVRMARAAYWECLRNDVLRVFTHVEPHLVEFHHSIGFRKPVTHVPDIHGTTAMALDPFDADALRAVGSPLVALLDAWREHSPIAECLHAGG